ncbi:ParB/RepB/Spo0J family partition protein [Patescibacteria group bacterium]|nr:ParB/RepB/Spo0J family partition protein [Patescibacteria group bacterium]
MVDSILGRGLGSLIPNKLNEEKTGDESGIVVADKSEKVRQIPLSQIEANPMQPRESFDHSELEDLINSIKNHGILQPLIVTQKTAGSYQLIAGERRLKAAAILEMETVPCLIRKAEDMEKLELALIENLQRSDLNPMEEAKAYQKLVDDFSLTQEEVAEKVGKKRATIANILRLLELPEEIQRALREKKITIGHAKVILSAETDSERIKLFKKIIKNDFTVRQTEGEIKKVKVRTHFRTAGKDLETEAKEDSLRKALGTKVTITKKGQGGQIDIEYYSLEELNNLVDRITQ